MSAVTAATALYGVAGDPVVHSLSPALHNAAFGALGIDAISVALRADESGAAAVVDAVRHLGVRGLSVTMPLKGLVAPLCDERSTTVERLGASNCLVGLGGGAVRAESTDGRGIVDAVRCVAAADLDGSTCAVLGAGGAARAAIEALCAAGAARVLVVARRPEAAEAAAAVCKAARAATPDEAAGALVIVQATPVGMAGTHGAGADPLLDAGTLGAGQVAVDLVYHPRVTPWLAQAASRGASPVGGAEVLAHQAALALGLWLGAPVPLDALHAVVAAP